MRSPSARVLVNTCDIYSGTPTQDMGGGPQWSYPALPTLPRQACSAQPVEVQEIAENDRVTRLRIWEVMFAATTNTKARDKLVITDRQGVQHVAFAHDEQDQAGRGSAFIVYAEERL